VIEILDSESRNWLPLSIARLMILPPVAFEKIVTLENRFEDIVIFGIALL
jgi:hypothetical protein